MQDHVIVVGHNQYISVPDIGTIAEQGSVRLVRKRFGVKCRIASLNVYDRCVLNAIFCANNELPGVQQNDWWWRKRRWQRFQYSKHSDSHFIQHNRFLAVEQFILLCLLLINWWKGKPSCLHEQTAASVLLKLFISSNEWCHTTVAF